MTHVRRVVYCLLMLMTTMVILLFSEAVPAQVAQNSTALTTIRLTYITPSLATVAAREKGFWTQENLNVEAERAPSSTKVFEGLRDGTYDVALIGADNVVNYRFNSNTALDETLDVQIFMGADYGRNLTLVSNPNIASLENLRGKTLGVDAPNSGFAFVLYKMLRNAGLERDTDYTVVEIGGTPDRYDALLGGQIDATLLNNGFEVRATNAGYKALSNVTDVVRPYLGGVGTAREGWLQQHRDVVQRIIRAYYHASQWVVDPANREEAIALLAADSDVDSNLAAQLYQVQIEPGVGIVADVDIDRRGLYNNMALRQEFGGFEQPQNLRYLASPASKLYDRSYYRQALR